MFKSNFAKLMSVAFVVLIFALPNLLIAEIKVYDHNNQYLGITSGIGGNQNLSVFIPSIKASYSIWHTEIEKPDWCIVTDSVVFESDDCSGTPYARGTFPHVINFNCQPYDGHYLPDISSGKKFTPKSMHISDMAIGELICTSYIGPPELTFYEIKEIQLPFTTPIALPVRFENVAGTSDFFVIPVKKK